MPFGRHDFTPGELSEQLAAERRGTPHLILRERGFRQRLLFLDGTRMTIGRAAESDLTLDWDPEVSRVHALLERIGGRWTVADDGLSRNGTFVNGRRISARRRLAGGDVLRVGRTELLFRAPGDGADPTPLAADAAGLAGLTEAQRRVLAALCRPLAAAGAGTPVAAPSNREIAEQLALSVETVRTHMKELFELLEVPALPPNRKRAELARRAIASGLLARV